MGGTPANLQAVTANINGSAFFAFLGGAALGFNAAYPAQHLLSDLTPAGQAALAWHTYFSLPQPNEESVFFTQNLNVLSGGSWAQAKATPVVHDGGVCQGGVSCTSNGNDNRDLFDDFGVAASPATGLASITYSDDQYADNTGTANSGECTTAQYNTSACDHTDYATQTSGNGIG